MIICRKVTHLKPTIIESPRPYHKKPKAHVPIENDPSSSKESTSNKVSITEIPRANCFIESFASIKFKFATTLQLSSASAAAAAAAAPSHHPPSLCFTTSCNPTTTRTEQSKQTKNVGVIKLHASSYYLYLFLSMYLFCSRYRSRCEVKFSLRIRHRR